MKSDLDLLICCRHRFSYTSNIFPETHSTTAKIEYWGHLVLMPLRYCLIDSTIRAVTVVFISIAKCLKSSSRSVGIFIVVLVSSPIVSSVPIYNIYIYTVISMYG